MLYKARMSHFTVAFNDVLERMKKTSGVTQKMFADRVDMPLSTLSSYLVERTRPDSASLSRIIPGLEESDARRIIIAHLTDETPKEWRGKLAVKSVSDPGAISFSQINTLPKKFRNQIEALVVEAKSNEHVIGFIDEFASLLGIPRKEIWPHENIPVQSVPAQFVRTSAPPSSSTSSPLDQPAAAQKKNRLSRVTKSRAELQGEKGKPRSKKH